MNKASLKDDGFALFLPAISKPVPWSGEVLILLNPAVKFTPLPNDLLILFLAAIEYPAKKMNGIIILADLTFALMLTAFAARGITLFF